MERRFGVKEYILGSNIDSISSQAPCEVTVVKFGREEIGSVLALAGSGPNASLAVRRAHELDKKAGLGELTVLNVQKGEKGEEELQDRGMRMIEKTTNKARLESSEYESKVMIEEDVEGAILEEVQNYDTVCIGWYRTVRSFPHDIRLAARRNWKNSRRLRRHGQGVQKEKFPPKNRGKDSPAITITSNKRSMVGVSKGGFVRTRSLLKKEGEGSRTGETVRLSGEGLKTLDKHVAYKC